MNDPMQMMDGYFTLMEVALGIYFLYCAITGKGKIYDMSEVPEASRGELVKYNRILSYIMGPVLLFQAALSYFKFLGPEVSVLIYKIILGFDIVFFIVYMIFFTKKRNELIGASGKKIIKK
ncbi:MAG: hypothetical protein E7332_01855 [Clostridiales bacterium]|nr:hypothetical protein [Clostridiales bacterium]